jgi:hypothetical protein
MVMLISARYTAWGNSREEFPAFVMTARRMEEAVSVRTFRIHSAVGIEVFYMMKVCPADHCYCLVLTELGWD